MTNKFGEVVVEEFRRKRKDMLSVTGGAGDHALRYQDSIPTMVRTDEAMEKTIRDIRVLGFKDQETIWQTCKELNRLALEHSKLARDILFEDRDDEVLKGKLRELAARNKMIAESVDQIFGERWQSALKGFDIPTAMLVALEDGLESIRVYWRTHAQQIAAIDEETDLLDFYLNSILFGFKFKELGGPTQRVMTHTANQGKGRRQ